MTFRHETGRTLLPIGVALLAAMLLLALILAFIAPRPVYAAISCGGADIAGTVFRDFDQDGFYDITEVGVPHVTVRATGSTGASQTCQTLPDGTYGFTIDTIDFPVRLEFSWDIPELRSGPQGPDSETTVAFVDGRTQFLDMGVSNPAQYCSTSPTAVTSCFLLGPQSNLTAPVVIDFPYTAGSSMISPIYSDYLEPTVHNLNVPAQAAGSIYGLAYSRSAGTMFAGAFMRRHSGFGPAGPGGIYAIDPSSGLIYTYTVLMAGTDPHTTSLQISDWWRDTPEAFTTVGKIGLGDLDMSSDENTLWVTNLYDRGLYQIDILNPFSPVSYTLSADNALQANCAAGGPDAPDLRPFGIGIDKDTNTLYWGVVCSNQTGLNSLSANIFAFDPATPEEGFQLAVTFPLTYRRACVQDFGGQYEIGTRNCPSQGPIDEWDIPATWQPWSDTFDSSGATRPTFGPPEILFGVQLVGDPQPWIQDIEFLPNRDMIIGLGDRFAYQTGYRTFGPNTEDTVRYSTSAGGDILRVCWNELLGQWKLEADGFCGVLNTGGSSRRDGPGGGEFYYDDSFKLSFSPLGDGVLHDENVLGALAQAAGTSEVLVSVYDASNASDDFGDNSGYLDGGVRWFGKNTGDAQRAYVVFDTAINPPENDPITFGKAAGLGDLELICGPAPLQIGNRVWRDLDMDGEQDPNEPPFAGVNVTLYTPQGFYVDATTTDSRGGYYFSVDPNSQYVLAFDPIGLLTFEDQAGGNDNIDSDAVMAPALGFPWDNQPIIRVATVGPGENNHTYDVGFVQESTDVSLINLTGGSAWSPGWVWLAGGGLLGLAWWLRRRSAETPS